MRFHTNRYPPEWAEAITHQLTRMEHNMATQADIDALTDSVNTDRTAIATVVAELNTLIAAGQPVQVAALQAAVSGLTSDIAADAPPAPAPAAMDPSLAPAAVPPATLSGSTTDPTQP